MQRQVKAAHKSNLGTKIRDFPVYLISYKFRSKDLDDTKKTGNN